MSSTVWIFTRTTPIVSTVLRLVSPLERFDFFVHFLWEFEIAVNVALSGIIRIGTDWKFLPLHPLEDSLAFGRIVVARFDLLDERFGALGIDLGIFFQVGGQLFAVEKMACHHGEDQAAIMADAAAGVQGRDQVRHHRFVL